MTFDGSTTVRAPHPHPSEAATILRVEHLGVSFRGIRALDDVTFTIPKGGVSAVIGPNGAGKTTLFNCISGVARHVGSVRLAEHDLSGLRADRRTVMGIARTFQTPLMITDATPMENVLLGAHATLQAGVIGSILRRPRVRTGEHEARQRAAELMERLGLDPRDDRVAGSLPHGDRRRIEIARALIGDPLLLLLDEPAAGLGAQETDRLLEDIGQLAAATGMTCLLVEHDVALVMRVSRHLVVLDAGRLLVEGPPADVAADRRVVAAYLGNDWSEVKP